VSVNQQEQLLFPKTKENRHDSNRQYSNFFLLVTSPISQDLVRDISGRGLIIEPLSVSQRVRGRQ
jgi:hypothetical protein